MLIRPKNRHYPLFLTILLILNGCSSDGGTENAAGVGILEDNGDLTTVTGESAEPVDITEPDDTSLPNSSEEPSDTNEPVDIDVEIDEAQEIAPPNEPTAEELGAPSLNASLNDSVTSFINALEDVVAESLVEMNGRLQSGEDLDPVQSTCLGTYDPAFGEALLAIGCGTEQLPISVPNFSMFLASGAVAGTSSCNDGLLGLDGNSCRLASADLLMPVEWSTPEGSLPQPFASGFMEYNLEPNSLRIFSLENPVTPTYDCTFDLANATVDSNLTFGNCNAELDRLTLRLEAWLDRR